MELLIAFVAGAIIAIISSVPIGPIGFAIVHAVIARGRQEGMRVGLGGLIVDTAFSFLALRLTGVFNPEDNPELFAWINLVSIPVLVILGLNMIRNRHKEPDAGDTTKAGKGYLLGFTIGITNPILFGYWVWVVSYGTGAGWIGHGMLDHLVFTGGVIFGMVAFLLGWTRLLSAATMSASKRFRATLSLLVGVGFIVFSGFLAINYLSSHVF
jgi:threonine/homoserine/homoserine lactone efflux protein